MPSPGNYRSRKKTSGQNQLALLKEQIKTGDIKSVYLFSGNERFLVDHYVGEIRKAALKEDQDGLNLVQFEGKIDVNQLVDACETFPIFSERKVVLVKHSNLLTAKRKAASKQDEDESRSEEADGGGDTDSESQASNGGKAQDALKKYLPNIPENTCLIMMEDNVDKRMGLYKTIQKAGLHIHLDHLDPEDLTNWVIKGFRQSRKIIHPDAARYLVTISDPDMYSLRNEIFKIIHYTGNREMVDLDDIRAVATVTIKSVIFDLMDAVAAKDRARALTYLDDMLSLKEPEQKILAMISKQTGEILKLRLLLDRHLPPSQINGYFPGKHPFVLRKLSEQAQRSDRTYLTGFLRKCADADNAWKTGRMSPRLSLEMLVNDL